MESNGSLSDLPTSTYELLRRTAQAHPRAPALSYFARAEDHRRPLMWNYRQLFAQVTRAANSFHRLGARKDTVIAVVLPNLPETHFAVWGGEAAGISLPINYLLEPAAIVDLIDATGASILVTAVNVPGVELWEKLRPHLGGLKGLRHVLLVDAATPASDPGRVDDGETSPRKGSYELHDLAKCLRQQPGSRLLGDRRIDPEDVSSYLCTGGTTGAPKVAIRRHRNEVANAWSTAQCLGDGIAPGKNVFCGLPLFHANGLLVTGLLPFSRGAHVIIGTPLGYRGPGVLEHFWSIVDHHQVHFFSAVPTIYGALLQKPRGVHRLESLEYGLCGAAPMPRELIQRFEQETGVKILEGYGLTEGTCVSSLNPPVGERRAGSIGLRVPGQAMKAVVLNP
ncbi:MAG: AMP-binding protein, partial [Actinomycetota bacterium]|nr:AMP-binding protein [Actinomycetota bacterium]